VAGVDVDCERKQAGNPLICAAGRRPETMKVAAKDGYLCGFWALGRVQHSVPTPFHFQAAQKVEAS
jgi:hypothetical protein